MWLIIALLLKGFLGQHIIQIGDKEFVGEDPVLTQMLHARTAVPCNAKIALRTMPKEYFDNKRLFSVKTDRLYLNDTRRFINEPPRVEQKKRAIELMQHNIYVTQYRLQHLKNITDKYSKDISFRASMIFSRIDTLIREMRIMYTYMNRTIERIYTFWSWLVGSWDGRKRPVYMHLIYYTHILKRNIDVTYLVEHMISVHTKYMTKHYKLQPTPGGANVPGGGTDIQYTGPPPLARPPKGDESDTDKKPPRPGGIPPGPDGTNNGGPGGPPGSPHEGGPQGGRPHGGRPSGDGNSWDGPPF